MANNPGAKKRIRQSAARRLRNRFQKARMRSAVKRLRSLEEKNEAEAFYPKVASLIDKSAKRNLIHKRNASNLKSKLSKHINSL